MAGEQIQQFGAAVVPDENVRFVVADAGERQVALQFAHVGLDADLLPLVGDHLGQFRVGQEGLDGDDLDAQPFAVVGADPEAGAVLFGQADLVQQRVRLLDIERGPFLAPFRPGILRHALRPGPAIPACRRPARRFRSAGPGRCPCDRARRKSALVSHLRISRIGACSFG